MPDPFAALTPTAEPIKNTPITLEQFQSGLEATMRLAVEVISPGSDLQYAKQGSERAMNAFRSGDPLQMGIGLAEMIAGLGAVVIPGSKFIRQGGKSVGKAVDIKVPKSVRNAQDSIDRAEAKVMSDGSEAERITNPKQQGAATRAENRLRKVINEEFPGMETQDKIALRTALQNGDDTFAIKAVSDVTPKTVLKTEADIVAAIEDLGSSKSILSIDYNKTGISVSRKKSRFGNPKTVRKTFKPGVMYDEIAEWFE